MSGVKSLTSRKSKVGKSALKQSGITNFFKMISKIQSTYYCNSFKLIIIKINYLAILTIRVIKLNVISLGQ